MNRETVIAIFVYLATLSIFAITLWLFLVGVATVQGEREEHSRIHGRVPAQVAGVRGLNNHATKIISYIDR